MLHRPYNIAIITIIPLCTILAQRGVSEAYAAGECDALVAHEVAETYKLAADLDEEVVGALNRGATKETIIPFLREAIEKMRAQERAFRAWK